MINKPYYNLSKNDEINIKEVQKTFPVSLSRLSALYDIKLYEADLHIMVSGQILKSKNTYKVTVQKGQSTARQRFTAAHELAHFFLHRDKIGDGIVDNAMYRSSLPSELETQANKLAADILMPMSEVNKKLKEKSNIGELAKYFDVSNQAMQVRLGIPV